MAASHQQFSLKWNNYSQHIVSALEELRVDDELTDVTLSCDGKRIKAHKLLLSACSVYFRETFKENPCKHPVVILKGVSFQDLQSVVQFMYNGQVNVTQERLPSFLQTAETLQIKGLTDSNGEKDEAPVAQPPVKKRSQTFPSQLSSAVDSIRQEADSRPLTPKRKRVTGSSGGSFTLPAQNSELPGTASVISGGGPIIVSGSAGSNSSQHSNSSTPAPPPLVSRNNSDSSTDGLPLVKYEEEQEIDEEYERGDDNDNSCQEDIGKDGVAGESNSLGSITSSNRNCTSLTASGATGERRPRYTVQSSSNEHVASAGVVDTTNVNGRQHNGHLSRVDLTYNNQNGGYAHTNGTLLPTAGHIVASKLRHRLSSRSLSSGGGNSYHPYQSQDPHDRVIKYAPMQHSQNSSSSHDSRSNSSHEDAVDRHYLDDGSESMQGTDEDDEVNYHSQHHYQKRFPKGTNGSILVHAHQQQKSRVVPNLVKSISAAAFHSQQQQPINYRTVVNGTTNPRSNGFVKASSDSCTAVAEDLTASSPAAATNASEMSTPSFSLTQQLLQQNVLSLISSNGGAEVIRSESASSPSNRVSAITVQTSLEQYPCPRPGSLSSGSSSSASKTDASQPTVAAPYVCDVCGKRYVHHRSLNDHKKSHTGATRCPVCNKSFSKVANMRAHYQAQHGILSENGAAMNGEMTIDSQHSSQIAIKQEAFNINAASAQ